MLNKRFSSFVPILKINNRYHLINQKINNRYHLINKKINNRYHLINQKNFLICIKYEYNQYTILLKRKKLIFANFQINNFFSHTVTEVPVPNEESEQSCARGINFACNNNFWIRFWNCSDSVVFFVFYFIFRWITYYTGILKKDTIFNWNLQS